MVEMQYHWLIFSISIVASLTPQSLASDDILQPFSSNDESSLSESTGPITTAMENLAYNTASVADEISMQVSAKLERTADILHGGIELLIANALEQLSQPIYQATRKLSNANCNATFTLADLHSAIDMKLSLCTEELNVLMQTFKKDAENSVSAIENFVNEIVNLPKQCDNVNESSTFAAKTRCFVEGMTALNEQFSNELNTIGTLLSRNRQLSQQGETLALVCIETIVNEVVKLIDDELANC